MSTNKKITPVGGKDTKDTKLAEEEELVNKDTAIAEAFEAGKAAAKAEADAKKEKASKEADKRTGNSRKRIPLGTRNVLTAAKRPGYVRRFVNDKGDRIQTFKDAGWSAADVDGQVGDDKAGRATSMGSGANPSVGGGQRAVLMEIPEKLYKEDEKAKQDKIAKVEKEIARNSPAPGKDGLEGSVSIS